MRIERIGENKIRIFVSYDDLEERDIDLDAFNYNSPETQELFWDLMEQAEIELGFDAQDSQLFLNLQCCRFKLIPSPVKARLRQARCFKQFRVVR